MFIAPRTLSNWNFHRQFLLILEQFKMFPLCPQSHRAVSVCERIGAKVMVLKQVKHDAERVRLNVPNADISFHTRMLPSGEVEVDDGAPVRSRSRPIEFHGCPTVSVKVVRCDCPAILDAKTVLNHPPSKCAIVARSADLLCGRLALSRVALKP